MIDLGDDFSVDVDCAEHLVLMIDFGDDVFVHVIYAEHRQS